MLWSGTQSQPDYQIPELLNKGVLPLKVCDFVQFSVCNRMTRSAMTALKGKLCIADLNVDEYEESLSLILDHIYQPHLISIRTRGSMADLVHVLNNIAGRALGWTVQQLRIMVEPDDDDDMNEDSKLAFFEGALRNCVLAVLNTSCLQVLKLYISSEAPSLGIDILIPLAELVEKSRHLHAAEFFSPGNFSELLDLSLSMRSSGWDVVCSPLLQNEHIYTHGTISAVWNRNGSAHGPDATGQVNVQKKMEEQVEFEFSSWQQRIVGASHPMDLAIELDLYILKVEASNREVPDVQSEAEERDNLFGLVKEFLRALGFHHQNSDWAATLEHLLLEQSAQVRIALWRMLLRYSTMTYLENVLVSAQCEEPLGYFQMLEVEMVLEVLVHSVTEFDPIDTSLDLAVLRLFAIHCWCVILRWLDKAEICNRILCDWFWPILQRSPEAQPYWWSLMRTAQSQSILSRLPTGFDVPHKSQQKLLPKFMYNASRWIRNEFSESCSDVDFALHLDINERFAWEPHRNAIPCILACAVERSMVMAWQRLKRGPQGETYKYSHAVLGHKHTSMKFAQTWQPMGESDLAGSRLCKSPAAFSSVACVLNTGQINYMRDLLGRQACS